MRKHFSKVSLVTVLLFVTFLWATGSFIVGHGMKPSPRTAELSFTGISPSGAKGGKIFPASCEAGYQHIDVFSTSCYPCQVSPASPNVYDTVTWSIHPSDVAAWIDSGNYVFQTYLSDLGWDYSGWAQHRTSMSVSYSSAGWKSATLYFTEYYWAAGQSQYMTESCSVYVNPPVPCSSNANSCGDRYYGYVVDGSCTAGSTAPGERSNWNLDRTSSANACGATAARKTGCDGGYDTSAPGLSQKLITADKEPAESGGTYAVTKFGENHCFGNSGSTRYFVPLGSKKEFDDFYRSIPKLPGLYKINE